MLARHGAHDASEAAGIEAGAVRQPSNPSAMS